MLPDVIFVVSSFVVILLFKVEAFLFLQLHPTCWLCLFYDYFLVSHTTVPDFDGIFVKIVLD